MKPTRADQRRARRALLRQTATIAFALGLAKVVRRKAMRGTLTDVKVPLMTKTGS